MMRQADGNNSGEVIVVKVLPLGGTPREITLNKDEKVQEALDAAGYSNATARVDGVLAEPDAILEDGDRIVVTNTSSDKIEGGL